jgi:hypothetical protein
MIEGKNEREKAMISFNILALISGWAELEIALSENTFTCHFEFTPNNPLVELLKGALDTISLKTVSTRICFHNCSDSKTLLISKQNGPNCLIVIQNELFEVPIKQFVKAILRMFDRYIYIHPQSEKEEEWSHFFPVEDIERLRLGYHSLS